MEKIVVIGLGASGIIASLKLSENYEVIALEKNDKCGKKLLLTGNGRCNYWHNDITIDNYYTDNYDRLKTIISKDNLNDTFSYLSSLGIYPKVKNGYYYPYSNQAYSIRELFSKHLEKNKNIKLFYNTEVFDINKKTNQFIINTNNGIFIADKVVIACGSKAYPKTGSDGFSYEVAKKFNVKVNPVLPALVSLKCDEEFLNVTSGLRIDSELSLYINDEFICKEEGEVQFTDYGISGICVFNMSSIVARNLDKRVNIKINFLPKDIDIDNYFNDLNQNLFDALECIMSYKMISVILKRVGINGSAYYKSLTADEKSLLKENLCNFNINVNDVGSFEKGQVCTGGISLNSINEKLESTEENLYFIGEALDVDGKCGGYNLAFAFTSAYSLAKNIYKE